LRFLAAAALMLNSKGGRLDMHGPFRLGATSLGVFQPD
jgi:hypothetical protein